MSFADYYTASGQPGDHSPGASAAIRAEFQLLQNAFGQMPDLDVANAGFLVRVNVSGTGLDSFDASTFYVPAAGGTMTGTLKNTNSAAMRLVNNGGFIEAYNTAETTRTGFLQFNSAGSVLLRALAPATTGLILQTEGGTLALDQLGAAVLNGPSLDITRGAAVGSILNLRGNANAAATALFIAQGVASEAYLYNRANNFLSIGTNNTERIRVLAGGSVGIGTSGPSSNLDVRQDTGDGPILALTNRIANASNHRFGALVFSGFRDVADPCYGAAVWGEGTSGAANVSDLVFGAMTNNSAGAMPTERMRITAGGLVGVGRVPTSKQLEVQAGILAGFADSEALRIINDTGYVAFWNAANSTRTGYLQGIAGTGVHLGADAPSGVINLFAGAVQRLQVAADGRIFLNAIHNNGAGAAGTTPMVASGTYTPTIGNVANIAANAARVCQWLRVGNVVTVSGSVLVTPASGSTSTSILVSLPIVSNILGFEDCAGAFGAIDASGSSVSMAGPVRGNSANDAADLRCTCTASTAASEWAFNFTYLVH